MVESLDEAVLIASEALLVLATNSFKRGGCVFFAPTSGRCSGCSLPKYPVRAHLQGQALFENRIIQSGRYRALGVFNDSTVGLPKIACEKSSWG